MEQFNNFATILLAVACASGDATITVSDASLLAATGTFRLRIDSEIVVVTSRVANVLTVTRGQEGTAAAAHPFGAVVIPILTAGAIAQLKTDISGSVTPAGDVNGTIGANHVDTLTGTSGVVEVANGTKLHTTAGLDVDRASSVHAYGGIAAKYTNTVIAAMGTYDSSIGAGALWLGQATPNAFNFCIEAEATRTLLNAPAGGTYEFRMGAVTNYMAIDDTAHTVTIEPNGTIALVASTAAVKFGAGSGVANVELAHGSGQFGGNGTDWYGTIGPDATNPNLESCVWLLPPGTSRSGTNMSLLNNGSATYLNTQGTYLSFSASSFGTNLAWMQASTSSFYIWGMPNFTWTSAGGAPVLSHEVRPSDLLPGDFTVRSQYAYASATGANRKSGNIVFDVGPPTNGGTSEASVQMSRNGSAFASFANNATTLAALAGTGSAAVAADASGSLSRLDLTFASTQTRKVAYWSGLSTAYNNATMVAGSHYWGYGALTFNGTGTVGAFGTTSKLLATKRNRYASTTASSIVGIYDAAYLNAGVAQIGPWRGNAAGRGGFVFRARFAIPVVGNTSVLNMFCGLAENVGASSTNWTTDNTIAKLGIGFSCTTTAGSAFPSANFKMIESDHNTPNLTDLGSNFSLSLTRFVEVVMFATPNDSKVSYTVTDLESGTTTSGVMNTQLPTNTRFFLPYIILGIGTSTSGTNALELALNAMEWYDG